MAKARAKSLRVNRLSNSKGLQGTAGRGYREGEQQLHRVGGVRARPLEQALWSLRAASLKLKWPCPCGMAPMADAWGANEGNLEMGQERT